MISVSGVPVKEQGTATRTRLHDPRLGALENYHFLNYFSILNYCPPCLLSNSWTGLPQTVSLTYSTPLLHSHYHFFYECWLRRSWRRGSRGWPRQRGWSTSSSSRSQRNYSPEPLPGMPATLLICMPSFNLNQPVHVEKDLYVVQRSPKPHSGDHWSDCHYLPVED